MSDYNKLIVGVSLPSAMTVTVGQGPKVTLPDLVAVGRNGSTEYKSYNETTKTWAIPLGAGDWVLTLTLPQAQWFEGALSCSVPSTSTFVWWGAISGVDQLVAWSATVAATSGDPKDPWPPPGTPTVTLGNASATWFTTRLTDLRNNQNTPRGVALGFP